MSKPPPELENSKNHASTVLMHKLNTNLYSMMREKNWNEFKQLQKLDSILELLQSSTDAKNKIYLKKMFADNTNEMKKELYERLSATIAVHFEDFVSQVMKKLDSLTKTISQRASKVETSPVAKKRKINRVVSNTKSVSCIGNDNEKLYPCTSKPKSYIENIDLVDAFSKNTQENANSSRSSFSTTLNDYVRKYKMKKDKCNTKREIIDLFSSSTSSQVSDGYFSVCSQENFKKTNCYRSAQPIPLKPHGGGKFMSAKTFQKIKIKKEKDDTKPIAK